MNPPLLAFPVGYVRSALRDPAQAPRQGREAGSVAEIEILPEYRDALDGLELRERVLVVCWLHRARRDLLRVVPRGDPALPGRGVFATRSPNRPNPLAVYTADLLGVPGARLQVRGLDAVDGTPVLDVRPHVARLDD